MSDQSKSKPETVESATSTQGSLIERAASHFDFTRSASTLKPAELPPRRPAAPKSRAAPSLGASEATRAQTANADAFPKPSSVGAEAVQPSEPVLFSSNQMAVDREYLRESGMIVPEGAVTTLLEEFRIVKRQLLVQAADLRRQKGGAKAQRILISSPHSGEGKTYCAVNLALSIAAEKEGDVLLVDADFAKPSILSVLGLSGGPGLMDALMDETIDVAELVIATDIPGLWVLPAGNTSTSDSEYISSSRTAKILDRLTQNAPNRMVIFDSPPALAASPAAELAKLVGQVLMIVRADSTGQGALEDAVSLLSACPNIELMLNAAQFSPSGRRFGTYYGYKG